MATSEFYVQFEAPAVGSGWWESYRMPPLLEVTPIWYDWDDRGGPNQATLRVTGPMEALWTTLSWLSYQTHIYNRNNVAVWWGSVSEVMVSSGNVQIGLSLDDMYNSVIVAYTERAADGSYERKTTTAATNDDSVDRYGAKEILLTLSDVNTAGAEQRRDTVLAAVSKPVSAVRMELGYPVEATITCSGFKSMLGWQYYAQPNGLEEYTTGSSPQSIGVGGTATTIGFDNNRRIVYDVGTGLFTGQKFVVGGSSSNNGTWTVAESAEIVDATLTASTISFSEVAGTEDDDLYDSANSLDNFTVDDVIQVEGSTSNDGIYQIKTYKDDGHIEVDPSVLVYEAAGASVTLRRRSYVRTEEDLAEEDAGASVTVTGYGAKVAQSFQLSTSGMEFSVAAIAVKLAKAGSPTDNVRVGLHSDSSGSPGTELDYGTIDGSTLSHEVEWAEFALNNTDTVSYGTTYWVVISRSGSNDLDDYYVTSVDEELGYTDGQLKVWDGSAWQTRATNADMPFRILGAEATTTQIATIAGTAAIIDDVAIIDASGVESNQYREGEATALDEIIELLDMGDSNDDRLVAIVSPERILKIAAASPTLTWWENNLAMLHDDGRLYTAQGMPWEHGRLPVGQFVHLTDVPSVVGYFADVTPFYVQRAEFDVESGTYTLEPLGATSPWEVGSVRQG